MAGLGMSCDIDPKTQSFSERLAHYYGMPAARLRHEETSVHDIASSPGQSLILLGKEYRHSDWRTKKQKVLHEYQHLMGAQHNAAARRRGYYSSPGKDRWSRDRLREVEKEIAMARRRNPVGGFLTAGLGQPPYRPSRGYGHDWSHASGKPPYKLNPTKLFRVFMWPQHKPKEVRVQSFFGRSEDSLLTALRREHPGYAFAVSRSRPAQNPHRRRHRNPEQNWLPILLIGGVVWLIAQGTGGSK